MAKRRNKKQQIARKRQLQKSNRPANRLEEAMEALKAGDYHSAITQGVGAYEAQNDEITQSTASRLLNEAYFRVAAKTTNMLTRLRHLDSALKYMSDDSRSHLHRGNTLVGMGRLDEALAAFQEVDPATLSQTKMNYPVQLARMAAGEKWFATGLSSIEANTLYLLESITEDAPDEEVEQCIEQMDKDDPQAAKTAVWKVLTQMYQKPKSAPQARLQNAVADNGTEPVLSYYLGVMSMRKGEPQAAKEYWSKAATDGLQSQWMSKNQALLLSEEAQNAAATGTWQEVIKTDYPSHLLEDTALGEIVAAAHDHLGYEAAKQNQWDKASRHWRKASESLQNRRLLQNLALSAEKTGDWSQAAESWRGVVKRRPRKTNHPDYLTDMQVAAIWHHAADCYEEEHDAAEVIHCLKNAIKYAPEDIDIRMSLARNYIRDDREEAAENELNKILEVDPDNIPALELLGRLSTNNWHHDNMGIWRRILEIEPSHLDARQALADAYIKKSHGLSMPSAQSFLDGFFTRMRKSEKTRVKWLEEGLEELPGHPKLLMELGLAYSEVGKKEQALDYLEQARQAASNDLDILTALAMSLLEMEEEEALLELRVELRELPRVTAMFWLSLANQTLDDELEDEWVQLWADEAIAAAKEDPDRYTVAYVLARLAEMSYGYGADEIGEIYEKKIQAEVPKSGAAEFAVTFKAYRQDDMTKARRMLQRGKTRAKRANEKDLLEHMEMVEMTLFASPLSILRMLEEGNIDIPPDFFS